jgi:hypothetical protein
MPFIAGMGGIGEAVLTPRNRIDITSVLSAPARLPTSLPTINEKGRPEGRSMQHFVCTIPGATTAVGTIPINATQRPHSAA